jgi:hypothetical protein
VCDPRKSNVVEETIYMERQNFNLKEELQKVLDGKKTKVSEIALLRCAAEMLLARNAIVQLEP